MLEIERVELVVQTFEQFCEDMNCIFCTWIQFDDIVSRYPMERICESAIFGVADAYKAYAVIFFYRKSCSARRRSIAQSLDMNSVHSNSLYIFYFRQYEFE